MGKTQCAVVVHGTVLFTITLYGYLSCVQLAGGGGRITETTCVLLLVYCLSNSVYICICRHYSPNPLCVQ